MKAIVYTSNTGFTKRYAELLSKETGLDAYELEEASKKLDAGAEVIYMGWLMAGSIKGYKKAARRYRIKAVCAVGMASPKDSLAAEIKARNKIIGAEVFYLQGGFDMDRLRGVYKLMMKVMISAVGKELAAKAEKSDEDRELLEMTKARVDKVGAENLADIVGWYKRGA